MKARSPIRREQRLLLLGAGHSHLEVLRLWAMNPLPGVEVVLVSPHSETIYSGMLPGFIAKQYLWNEITLDAAALAERAHATFLRDRAVKIDVSESKRRVELEGRPPLDFDVLSLDIGSITRWPPHEDEATKSARFLSTRPFFDFASKLESWDQAFSRNPRGSIGVVGAGTAGVELSSVLRARYPEAVISLFGAVKDPRVEGFLRGRKISLFGKISRFSLQKDHFLLKGESGEYDLDFLLMATGASASPLVAVSGLSSHDGFLSVRSTLQSLDHDFLFGAGDAIHFPENPWVEKAGVYAVREAPVLFRNLQAFFMGRSLEEYVPQKKILKIVNHGDGRATAERGSISLTGSWAFLWKDSIDRKFLGKYEMDPMPLEEPDCGGCGSKASADLLYEIVSFATKNSSRTILGPEGKEDVAVWKSFGKPMAFTIDQFRNFGVDPFLFGRIAAISAASDLYAKGIAPKGALMSLTLPKLGGKLAKNWSEHLFAGVKSVFEKEEIDLLGGQTNEGDEWNLGFTLWGELEKPLWEKKGLEEGDVLLLTKPIGTGILLSAAMQGAAIGAAWEEILFSMGQSQRDAYEVLCSAEVHAATDVTGFSLLGHLSEMMRNEVVALDEDLIPVFSKAEDFYRRGFRSRMHRLNQRSFPISELNPKRELFYDPQTSGGLLVSLPREEAKRVLPVMKNAYPHTAQIGRVKESSSSGAKIVWEKLGL